MFGQILGSIAGAAASKLFGGDDDEEAMRDQASINWNMQREFAQNGIRWRMADAKAAGIHPVAALGMQPANASPVAVGGSYGGGADAAHMASLGSDIGRSVMAKQTNLERLQERLLSSQIDGQDIDNALRASQLSRTSGSQLPPGLPTGNPRLDDSPSVPVSMKGTHLDNGPLVNADAVDFDSDPIGYLAARGVITAHDIGYLGRDLKNWFSNKIHSARSRGRQKYFTEGR